MSSDAEDTDGRSPKRDAPMQLSKSSFLKHQLALYLSIGNWFLLCLLEVAPELATDDGPDVESRWWSFATGGSVLVGALLLLIASRIHGSYALSANKLKVSPHAVVPVESSSLATMSELRSLARTHCWHVAIHSSLVAGALVWLIVHTASQQSQQVWRGIGTLYSLLSLACLDFIWYPETRLNAEEPDIWAFGERRISSMDRQTSLLSTGSLEENRSGTSKQVSESSGKGGTASKSSSRMAMRQAARNNTKNFSNSQFGRKSTRWKSLFVDPSFGNTISGVTKQGRPTGPKVTAHLKTGNEEHVACSRSMGFRFVEGNREISASSLSVVQQDNPPQQTNRQQNGRGSESSGSGLSAGSIVDEPHAGDVRRSQSSGSGFSDVSGEEDVPKPAHLEIGVVSVDGASASNSNSARIRPISPESEGSALSDVSMESKQLSDSRVQPQDEPASPPSCHTETIVQELDLKSGHEIES